MYQWELKNENINKLKIILANEATSMLHGKTDAIKAEKTAKETFLLGGVGKDLPKIKITKLLIDYFQIMTFER